MLVAYTYFTSTYIIPHYDGFVKLPRHLFFGIRVSNSWDGIIFTQCKKQILNFYKSILPFLGGSVRSTLINPSWPFGSIQCGWLHLISTFSISFPSSSLMVQAAETYPEGQDPSNLWMVLSSHTLPSISHQTCVGTFSHPHTTYRWISHHQSAQPNDVHW